MPTPEDIKAWLERLGKSQKWLAAQIGVSPRTIYNQLTAGKLRARTLEQIEKLMKEGGEEESPAQPLMTENEWRLIDRARQASGQTKQEFDRDALLRHARYILGNYNRPGGAASSMVREDPES